MGRRGRDRLDELAAAVDALGLQRLPVTFSGAARWWRQRWACAPAPDGTDAWTWCTRALEVPPGTVALAFGAAADELQWQRERKCWATGWQFQAGVLEPAGGFCAAAGPRARQQWWFGRADVAEIDEPAGVRWLPHGRAVTGRVTVVLERDERAWTQGLLLVAKRDTRFRRVGLWGLREQLAARLPAPWRELLVRGRGGSFGA